MSLACAIANNISSPRVNNHMISLQSTESYITSILPVLLLIIFYPLLVLPSNMSYIKYLMHCNTL